VSEESWRWGSHRYSNTSGESRCSVVPVDNNSADGVPTAGASALKAVALEVGPVMADRSGESPTENPVL
jgi:hypothetical protein